MLFTLSDCRIWLYSIMEYTATQIPFFGEAPETGLPFLCILTFQSCALFKIKKYRMLRDIVYVLILISL